jgi:hypothetical protein
MKCAVHQELDATGFCRNCGKPLCPQCTREVKSALYCEDCLANLVVAPPKSVAGTNSPAAATALGFVPGLGAVYNGEYIKALIHIVVFAALIGILSSNDMSDAYQSMFGILLGVFYLYMPIDAYRVAKARQAGTTPSSLLESGRSNRPIGAAVLIILGVLFLLNNFGWLRGDWVAKASPVALIALGVWLLLRRRQDTA